MLCCMQNYYDLWICWKVIINYCIIVIKPLIAFFIHRRRIYPVCAVVHYMNIFSGSYFPNVSLLFSIIMSKGNKHFWYTNLLKKYIKLYNPYLTSSFQNEKLLVLSLIPYGEVAILLKFIKFDEGIINIGKHMKP